MSKFYRLCGLICQSFEQKYTTLHSKLVVLKSNVYFFFFFLPILHSVVDFHFDRFYTKDQSSALLFLPALIARHLSCFPEFNDQLNTFHFSFAAFRVCVCVHVRILHGQAVKPGRSLSHLLPKMRTRKKFGTWLIVGGTLVGDQPRVETFMVRRDTVCRLLSWIILPSISQPFEFDFLLVIIFSLFPLFPRTVRNTCCSRLQKTKFSSFRDFKSQLCGRQCIINSFRVTSGEHD